MGNVNSDHTSRKWPHLSRGLTILTSCNFRFCGSALICYCPHPGTTRHNLIRSHFLWRISDTTFQMEMHKSRAKDVCWNACCCWKAWEWEHGGSAGWCDLPELDLFTPSLREAEQEDGALSQLIVAGRVVLHTYGSSVPYQTIHTSLGRGLEGEPWIAPSGQKRHESGSYSFSGSTFAKASNSLCLLSYLAKWLNNATVNLRKESYRIK